MARYSEEVLAKLERLVEAVEEETSVEVVVVLARRAEPYAEVAYRSGLAAALLALALLLYLPLEFSPHLILPDLLLGFAAGFALTRLSPRLTRWLTRASRRRASVDRAAAAAFQTRGVSLTRERTGLLVFVSWLEQELRLVPDVGVERRVPRDRWAAALRQLEQAGPLARFPDGLAEAFAPVRALLREHLPARDDDNPNEIPNRPVVL